MHPVLFEIGPVTIRSYGFMVALATLVFFSLVFKEARRKKFYPENILDLPLVVVVFGIIGSRILHVLVNHEFYIQNPLEIFLIWRGGLAFQGGFALGVLAGWAYIIRKRMPVWKTTDFIIPYVALGQSVGRIGCFLNGCCFGDSPAYPIQLYVSLVLVGIFVALKSVQEKPHRDGSVFALYLLLHGSQRFIFDFFRADIPAHFLGLTVSQFISLAFITTAILLFLRKRPSG